MPAADLGKAHVKVQLSDTIPGVIRDPEKLRQNYLWLAALNINSQADTRSYGTMLLSITAPDGTPLSSCIMPQATYEPQDNHMVDDVNDSETDDTDTYWAKQDWDATPRFFRVFVEDQDPKAPETDKQDWRSNAEAVAPVKYSEADYDAQQISYKGELFQKEEKTPEEQKEKQEEEQQQSGTTEENTEEEAAAEEDVQETENVSFIRQVEAAPGVWWGVRSRRFKKFGWPFWVTIRPSSINLKKGKAKRAMVSIKVRSVREADKKLSAQKDVLGDVELIIDTRGTYIYYSVIGPKKNSTDSKKKPAGGGSQQASQSGTTKSGKAEGEAETSTGSIVVNLPWLSEAFANQEEMRIGFLPVMGRLVIFTDSSRYAAVQFLNSDNKLLVYDTTATRAIVAGYGCSASVAAWPMTFYKRAWQTIPRLTGKDEQGHKFPKQNENGLKEGQQCDGRLISMPIDDTRLAAAQATKGGKGGNGKLYGAIFKEYYEVLLDATAAEAKAREAATEIKFQQPCPANGVFHPWGKLHLVRHKALAGFSDKQFWFAYFETEDLKRPPIDPATDQTPEEEEDTEINMGACGPPVLYRLMSYKPKNKKKNPLPESDVVTTITDDVVSFSFEVNLDSPRPTAVERSGSVKVFNTDGKYSQFLMKARGIRVFAKWSLKALSDDDSDFGVEEGDAFEEEDLIFSGIAFGRQSSQAPGEEYITFDCLDHWHVLDSIQIKNSPFYDGFYVGTVLDDLADRGGLDFEDDVDKSQIKRGGPRYYYLKTGTAFDKPLMRFSAEQTIKKCIMETISAFEVYVTIDLNGVLRMKPVPGGFLFNKTNEAWNPDVKETYYLDIDACDEPHQYILDSIEMTSTLSSSIYNSIYVLSVDRSTGTLIVRGDSNPKSLTDPDSLGYLGFIRENRLYRPDLGDASTALWWANIVLQMYKKPGFEVQFNTVGHVPAYIPGEFIRLKRDQSESGGDFDSGSSSEDPDDPDLFTKKFRVLNISHDYDASQNRWTTKVGAYQVEPADASFDPSQNLPQTRPPEGD